MHGQSRGSRLGMLSMIVRMEFPRPPLAMLRFNIPISEPSAEDAEEDGTRAASLL